MIFSTTQKPFCASLQQSNESNKLFFNKRAAKAELNPKPSSRLHFISAVLLHACGKQRIIGFITAEKKRFTFFLLLLLKSNRISFQRWDLGTIKSTANEWITGDPSYRLTPHEEAPVAYLITANWDWTSTSAPRLGPKLLRREWWDAQSFEKLTIFIIFCSVTICCCCWRNRRMNNCNCCQEFSSKRDFDASSFTITSLTTFFKRIHFYETAAAPHDAITFQVTQSPELWINWIIGLLSRTL